MRVKRRFDIDHRLTRNSRAADLKLAQDAEIRIHSGWIVSRFELTNLDESPISDFGPTDWFRSGVLKDASTLVS